MKNLLLILVMAILSGCLSAQDISVLSFNIRYDNPNDGENNWHNRKAELAELINSHNPDFIGAQEALYNQVQHLDSNLVNYVYIGVGRDDGDKAGEFSPVFYDTGRYELSFDKTIWLSKTPDEVSVGWDASMERICTYGVFTEKLTGKYIYVFNTHFDHIGKRARKKSASTIISTIEEMNIGDSSIIVMGDLNCEPHKAPIKRFNKVLNDPVMFDNTILEGPAGTFNGFDQELISDNRIDYIFYKNIAPVRYVHIDDKLKSGLCISDHLPVLATFNYRVLY